MTIESAQARIVELEAEIERLKEDQRDWRKGVAFIASCLGDKNDNLSCVRIAEVALEQRAKLEAAEAALAALREQGFTRQQVEAALTHVSRVDTERILERLGYTAQEIASAIR